MAESSSIEWTDATWNPITGCSVVSPGCTNCYAMRLAGTRLQHHPSRAGLTQDSKAGPVWNGQVRLNEQWLDQPLRWKKPRRIFVCAHGDLFHDAVPAAWIDKVFAVMALAPQHTFQILTKRSARMRAYVATRTTGARDKFAPTREASTIVGECAAGLVPSAAASDNPNIWEEALSRRADEKTWVKWPLPNVWLGVSAEDQQRADERIPDLLATPAAVRFLSAEPLLGGLDIRHALIGQSRLDWVIAGGESGPGARPCHPDWARGLRDQCVGAGAPFFFKQWGAWAPQSVVGYHPLTAHCPYGEFHSPDGEWVDSCLCREGAPGAQMFRVGKRAGGRLLDGRTWDEMPEVHHG